MEIEKFRYWKNYWQMWLLLLLGVLRSVDLYININNYKEIERLGILSDEMWEKYKFDFMFECNLDVLIIIFILGVFLVSIISRSAKRARQAEGVLMLLLTVSWTIAGIVFKWTVRSNIRIMWSVILLILLAGGLYTFWKIKRGHYE